MSRLTREIFQPRLQTSFQAPAEGLLMTNSREYRSAISPINWSGLNRSLVQWILVLAIGTTPSVLAETYSVLYVFTGGADGANPQAPLRLDSAGNLYGTTTFGGSGVCSPYGTCGVVFKLDSTGTETVLHSFTGYPTDGANPYSGVIRDSAGNLYGTAAFGGLTSSTCSPNGCGVVFRLDASGKETVLYSFAGGADGSQPDASLIRGLAGNLFGTTSFGGVTGVCVFGCGVVFKVNLTTRTEKVLYTFTGGTDGGGPTGNLIRDPAGNFYGTTAIGGLTSSICYQGCGVVFKLDPIGTETVLYRFTAGADGEAPAAGLIRDSTGNLYGTDGTGGLGLGVVFKLSPNGKLTVLHTFTGGSDGGHANSLIRDSAGNLYGTTFDGGDKTSTCSTYGCGVVFKLDAAGKETVLHTFRGGADGANPQAGLVGDSAGSIYGTTLYGGAPGGACGANGCGVVFKIKFDGP